MQLVFDYQIELVQRDPKRRLCARKIPAIQFELPLGWSIYRPKKKAAPKRSIEQISDEKWLEMIASLNGRWVAMAKSFAVNGQFKTFEDVEDAVSEIVLKIWTRRSKCKNPCEKFEQWATQVAKRQLLDMTKARKATKWQPSENLADHEEVSDPRQNLEVESDGW